MRLVLAGLVTAAISLSVDSAQAQGGRSQWIYARTTPNGPAAIFLDWTYSGVVLRIHCDRQTRELVFLAPVTPGSDQGEPPYQMDLSINEGRPMAMKTTPVRIEQGAPGSAPHVTFAVVAVEGRLALTRHLAKTIAHGSFYVIGAPNDDDEEGWNLGHAAPFRRVARDCPTR